jgi:hypothetical protein
MRRIASLAAALALFTAFPATAAVRKTTAAPVTRAAPAPAPAAAPASGGSFQLKDISVAGYIGGEFGDLDGLYLRADASAPIMAMTPKIDLLGVLSLGYNHFGGDFGPATWSWNMVKLVASARAQMELAPKIEGYADAGLGFYFGWSKVETTFPGLPPLIPSTTMTATGSSGGITMRFAVGSSYELNPQLKLGAELGFAPYFGDAETTNVFVGVGATYKL